MATVVCVPVTAEDEVDRRWGRAARVAIARADRAHILDWQTFEVGWDGMHDAQGEGRHHAGIARFLLDHGVEAVVAEHMGDPMRHMLERMGVAVHLGAAGPARAAVEGALGATPVEGA